MLSYAKGMGWKVGLCNVLVEGTSDTGLFLKAVEMHKKATGEDLLRDGLMIVCSGQQERGGARGVVNALTVMRALARQVLTPRGIQKYRFVGLVDDDEAGRRAIKGLRTVDASALEYRDIFRLRPEMVCNGRTDPPMLARRFEQLNSGYGQMRWELEDLLSISFVEIFLEEQPSALVRRKEMVGRVHWELTHDGKHRLHKFIDEYANLSDLKGVVNVIRSLRFCLGLSP